MPIRLWVIKMSRLNMNIRFDEKNVIVTGASTGIGRATAIEFANCGARVVVNYFQSTEAAKEVVEVIKSEGGDAIAIQADVSKSSQVDKLIQKSVDFFGERIDVLVNNAGGLIKRKAIMEVDESLWDECIDLNVKSVFLCCQAVVPVMKKQGHGKIVNVSSIAARNGGGPGSVHYSTSKSAVLTFTKGLAKELIQNGIIVNNVSPGVISTPFHDKFTSKEMRERFNSAIPIGREGTAQEIAWSIVFLASEYADYIVGETLEINGGLLMD
jgi:3-oxoacyl-[acyl-carrier protein] reductase